MEAERMTNLKTEDGRILKEIGQIAHRNSAGEFIDKQAVYIIVSEKDVNAAAGRKNS